MFDKFLPWGNLGKFDAASLVDKEKAIINELIEKSEINSKLRSVGLGYAVMFSYGCSGLLCLIGKRKDQPDGFLNSTARIPKEYISSIDIFITKDNNIITIDDGLGGLISMHIELLTAQPKLNIFSRRRTVRINKNFFETSTSKIDEICKMFSDPNAKIISSNQESQELLESCYLK